LHDDDDADDRDDTGIYYVAKIFGSTSRFFDMFLRELHALQAVRGLVHAPQLIDDDHDYGVIAMQPVADGTASGIKQEDLFTEALFRKVVEAALEVIPVLHKAGFVHGDISPSNILFECLDDEQERDSWKVYINDFSCSYLIDECPTQYFGTPLYSALSISTAKGAAISYTPICDWESLAWTLLDFALPLADTFTVREKSRISAALCGVISIADLSISEFRLPLLSKLRLHTGDQIFLFLCELFRYVTAPEADLHGVAPLLQQFLNQGIALILIMHCNPDSLTIFLISQVPEVVERVWLSKAEMIYHMQQDCLVYHRELTHLVSLALCRSSHLNVAPCYCCSHREYVDHYF
jgi:serine/threonine protein kinase